MPPLSLGGILRKGGACPARGLHRGCDYSAKVISKPPASTGAAGIGCTARGVMSEFTFKVNLVAVVRVRAADESVARQVVSTILGAPGTVEIGLANENNAAVGNHATITDVDFSFSLGSIRRFEGKAQNSTALLQPAHSRRK